jgi:hypothetical protein
VLNLSDQEQVLFDMLKGGREIALDDIEKKTGAVRHALVVRIKYLAAKLAPHGWIISNIAGIGRGVKAVYKMERKF